MPGLPPKFNRRKTRTPRTTLHREDVWNRTLELMGLKPRTSKTTSSTLKPFAESTASTSAMASEASLEPAAISTTPENSVPATDHIAEAETKEERKKTQFLDLPTETQKDILKHASATDLIALSLVSKHFRDIAAEQLYRTFHIVFPDEEDPANDTPIDGLAGGLDTFVTSEYDYATYLREIILETLTGGEKGERAYRHYLYDVSCGKFLSTLLLLTLRKATKLETFRWDIRVELSREVFKTLHRIASLKHLQIRMQVGRSLYQIPPAIPASSTLNSDGGLPLPPPPPSHSGNTNTVPVNPPPFNQPLFNPPPFPNNPPPPPVITNSFSAGSKLLKAQKSAKALLPTIKKKPPTISGFKEMKSLAVLDMDTLEYIDEIKECVKNSSASLSSLKLSFSETLANRSRKPPPEIHSDDDSDQEDEFGQLIPPPGGAPPPTSTADASNPTKAIAAQEEKKAQDAVLGRIFGIEPIVPRSPKEASTKADGAADSEDDPKKKFERNLILAAAKLMTAINPGANITEDGKETLAMVTKAARLYIEDMEKKPNERGEKEKKGKKEPAKSTNDSTAKATPASSNAGVDGIEEPMMSGAAVDEDKGLFDEVEKKDKEKSIVEGISNPDDINIEEPEGHELSIEFDQSGEAQTEAIDSKEELEAETAVDSEAATKTEPETKTETVPPTPAFEVSSQSADVSVDTNIDTLAMELEALKNYQDAERVKQEADNMRAKLEEVRSKFQVGGKIPDSDLENYLAAERAYAKVATQLEALDLNLTAAMKIHNELSRDGSSPGTLTGNPEMSKYVRETRGLTLQNLALYLIPIKATVLSKAIDLTVLQTITLLNVGPQTSFWNILSKENKISPLPLKKIHTDNVTLPFLGFVGQLDTLTELYLLERTLKTRVESTAAKTTVTTSHIRRVVLKKHAPTLKVLMIRNDAGSDWDLDVKSTMLLCQRAKLLEELAVSFGTKPMHTLLQFFPGLTNLRALHTIQFRTDDTCMWVMREFRKFAIDNVSHNPAMKLEYLALDNTVERLVRRPKVVTKAPEKKDKGKSKAISPPTQALAELILGQPGWSEATSASISLAATGTLDWQESSDEDDDEGEYEAKVGLKIESIEGIKFHDVSGVRIFEKEILLGRV
ncbi:hypothetical protein B7494_g143 [Chlorociboria aeruginascens]|nr:hypothetical protein B7494_g143 [Chlorociboria aeruginascens]